MKPLIVTSSLAQHGYQSTLVCPLCSYQGKLPSCFFLHLPSLGPYPLSSGCHPCPAQDKLLTFVLQVHSLANITTLALHLHHLQHTFMSFYIQFATYLIFHNSHATCSIHYWVFLYCQHVPNVLRHGIGIKINSIMICCFSPFSFWHLLFALYFHSLVMFSCKTIRFLPYL